MGPATGWRGPRRTRCLETLTSFWGKGGCSPAVGDHCLRLLVRGRMLTLRLLRLPCPADMPEVEGGGRACLPRKEVGKSF